VFIVTNAEKFKHFERWASANSFPRNNIINDGTTSHTGNLGALSDLLLAIRSKQVHCDFFVV
jgi:glucuronokinase